jgi:hypothetical protein
LSYSYFGYTRSSPCGRNRFELCRRINRTILGEEMKLVGKPVLSLTSVSDNACGQVCGSFLDTVIALPFTDTQAFTQMHGDPNLETLASSRSFGPTLMCNLLKSSTSWHAADFIQSSHFRSSRRCPLHEAQTGGWSRYVVVGKHKSRVYSPDSYRSCSD